MYCDFFGFNEKPFDVTPNSRLLYLSPSHQEALASLLYGIQERRGFIVLLGEVGTGKTTLLKAVLSRLDSAIRVASLTYTGVSFDDMLTMALIDLDIARPEERISKIEGLQRLNDLAIRQLAAASNVVLMVDEAQNLDVHALENLRLLSNLETDKHKLIQIVLSGQPELETKLKQPELRQLAQRISIKRCIVPLTEEQTYQYIQYRLSKVGYNSDNIFDSKALKLVWRYSTGVPRKINVICDNALLIGYALQQKKINAGIIKEVVEDLGGVKFRNQGRKPAGLGGIGKRVVPVAVAGTVAFLCFMGVFFREELQGLIQNPDSRLLSETDVSDSVEPSQQPMPQVADTGTARVTDAPADAQEDVTWAGNVEDGSADRSEIQGRTQAATVYGERVFREGELSLLPEEEEGLGSGLIYEHYGTNNEPETSTENKSRQVVKDSTLRSIQGTEANGDAPGQEQGARVHDGGHKVAGVTPAESPQLETGMKAALSTMQQWRRRPLQADGADVYNDSGGSSVIQGETPWAGEGENVNAGQSESVSLTNITTQASHSSGDTRLVLAEEGDTLSSIIIKNYGKFEQPLLDSILRLNPDIANKDLIGIGQAIKLPIGDSVGKNALSP